ncbi:hypothetical protein [Streptomyces uncialis]|uniref:hypothetical protein n=1 Tax=Streptomyces uncialis TaxID=1048205 RepID=UPI00225088E9|nr:hypothetical protein [Streptomyces uncialis]MCX4661567.1 hypothetical protein [Streptomyces uncialis]
MNPLRSIRRGRGRGRRAAELSLYLLLDGHLRLIPEDRNQRRAYDGHGDRNALTACLGAGSDGKQTEETLRPPRRGDSPWTGARPGRLLLTSDDAYEPYGDDDHVLTDYLTGVPRASARRLVENAVCQARAGPGPYADNATAPCRPSHLTTTGGVLPPRLRPARRQGR